MAHSDPPPLSETQMEIMHVVWEQGEVTLGQVWRTLSTRRKVARNTVQTLLTRLVEKGWLRSRAEGRVFHYSAAYPRESTLRQIVQRLVHTAFGGSTEGMVMALLDGQPLTQAEADRIRARIEQAEKGQ